MVVVLLMGSHPCAAGGSPAPGFFSGVFLRYSPASFEVTHWAKELAKKRVACDAEEFGTAMTFIMERVLPAFPKKVWQQLLPGARTKVGTSKELWGNLVAHLWKICLMEPKPVEDVLVVDGVATLSGSFGVRKGMVKKAILQSREPEYPLRLGDLEPGPHQQ